MTNTLIKNYSFSFINIKNILISLTINKKFVLKLNTICSIWEPWKNSNKINKRIKKLNFNEILYAT